MLMNYLLQYEGGVLEMFLTESQKHYYTAMKKLGRKKPQKVIKRPVNQFMAIFYDLSNSRRFVVNFKTRAIISTIQHVRNFIRFEIAIFVLIFLNMLTMGIEHYNQPVPVFFILEVCNAFFTTVFGLGTIYSHGSVLNNLYNKYIHFFFVFRGFSENYRSPVSLFYSSLECF